jgi:hypothetical protein
VFVGENGRERLLVRAEFLVLKDLFRLRKLVYQPVLHNVILADDSDVAPPFYFTLSGSIHQYAAK